MKYLCTLADKNYLKQGLALLKSLKDTSNSFTVYFLCLDTYTFQALQGIDNVIPIKLDELENSNSEILKYKSHKRYNEYCWSLASSFSKFLLETKSIDHILYIDADIYFYQSLDIIYDELNDKSIGIIRHRHNSASSPDGEFNVGIIYFKNDKAGLECVQWWNNAILNNTHPHLATCGDQKYLEEFIPMFGKSVCILDSTFAHGAPWNFRLYVYDSFLEDGTVTWGDKSQLLVFNHFSKFKILDDGSIDPTSGQYKDHTLNFQIFNIPEVRGMYVNYAKEIQL